MKAFRLMFGFVMLTVILGSAAYAADEASKTEAGSEAKGQMDPAMMEKMKALTAPSEAHKALEPFVGTWTYTGEFRMTSDALAQAMTGTQENTMAYGGRFLKQEITGPWMGETFHGLGYTGFDNIKGEYVSVWLDDMATGIMTMTGSFDAATQTLAQSGSNSCPLTGEKARASRSTWTVLDSNHTVYTSYMAGPDGSEFKSMEITYTRV